MYIFKKKLAVGFCPKKLAFARKMMALPESGKGAAGPPVLLPDLT